MVRFQVEPLPRSGAGFECLRANACNAPSDGFDESMDRAARQLQSAYRGYSVRRRKPLDHLRKIASVRRTLTELQEKAADPTYVERICVDVMECRKLTEGIMALLLQLDALQGVHPVVRDIRKSVNREVVQFMEVIDAVVVGAVSSPWEGSWNTPNIVRSNSISHLDRTSSYPLRRMYSLDNHVYPEQSHELPSHELPMEGTWQANCEPEKDVILTGKRADLGSASPTQGTGNFESLSPRKLVESSSHNQDARVHLGSFDCSSAALLIQSRFRGYRVRRTRPLMHLRSIADAKSKLRALSFQVAVPGFLAKLRHDNMERLKLTERITGLLLQLDSVQGVDQVVRDIRKSVTREVVKLQEVVDVLITQVESEKSCTGTTETGQEENCEKETPAATLLRDGKELPSITSEVELESVRNQQAGDLAVSDIPVLVQHLDLESRSILRHETEVNKVELATRGSKDQEDELERDHATVGVNNIRNSPARKVDDVQVRVLETNMQNNATSCSSTASAEENILNDQKSGSCAAVTTSGKGCSCPEYVDTIATLESGSPALEEASARAMHWEDLTKCHNNIGLVHVKARSPRAAGDDACLNPSKGDYVCLNMWGGGSPAAPLTNTRSPSVAQVDEAHHQDLGTSGAPLSDSIEQNIETGDLLRLTSSHVPAIGQFSVASDDCADDLEKDLILQKYNFVPSTFANHIPIPGESIDSEHLQQHERHSERGALSDVEVNTDLLPDFTWVAHTSEGTRACAPLRNQEGVCHTFASEFASRNDELSEVTGSSSTTTMENDKYQKFGTTELIGYLIEENTKLRTLLNEVLIFAEMQASSISTVKGRLQKLEGEVMQSKRREDILWRKSRNARRRR